MPIANDPNRFSDGTNSIAPGFQAASETDGEPVKQTCFKAQFAISPVIQSLSAIYGSYGSYFNKIYKAFSTGNTPLEVNFKAPDIRTEVRSIKGAGNATIKWAGYSEVGEASMSFYNYLSLDTYNLFYLWSLAAGGLILNPANTIEIDTGSARLAPDASSTYGGNGLGGVNYKTNVVVSQYYTTGTGNERAFNKWLLQGVFPASVSINDLNNAGDGDPVMTSVGFSVDLCVPMPLL